MAKTIKCSFDQLLDWVCSQASYDTVREIILQSGFGEKKIAALLAIVDKTAANRGIILESTK